MTWQVGDVILVWCNHDFCLPLLLCVGRCWKEMSWRKCVLCDFVLKKKGERYEDYIGKVKLVKVKKYGTGKGGKEYDLKSALTMNYPGISFEYDDFLCDTHLMPLPEGQTRYSASFPPILKESQGGAEWAAMSTRKRKPERYELADVETFGRTKKKLQFSEEKLARRDAEIFKLKNLLQDAKQEKELFHLENESLKKKIKELTDIKVPKNSEVVHLDATVDPLPCIWGSDPMLWCGVVSVEDFYHEVKPFLTSYYSRRYGCFDFNNLQILSQTLLQLRNGLTSRVLLPLLMFDRDKNFHRRTFQHVIDNLYSWALTQIFLLPASEWMLNNTELLDTLFPGHLFYFVDGTVLQIFEPSDIPKGKSAFNTKHSFCALTFFVVCAPNGRIVYVSCMDWGSTHDATAWNTSLKFPPVDPNNKGEERSDNKTFISSLEEFYGIGHSEDDMEDDGHPHPGLLSFLNLCPCTDAEHRR